MTTITAKLYDDLMFNLNGGYILPECVLSAIKVLCDEIGYTGSTQQNTYVNQYNANVMPAEKPQKPNDWNGGNSKNNRKIGGGSNNNRNGGGGGNEWKIKSGFALTKFAALDNSQQLIGDIRTDMNKLSEKNLAAKLETLKKHVNEIMDSSDSDNDSENETQPPTNKISKIMDVIYASSVNNKLPLLYSRAYETVHEMYPEEVNAFIEDKLKKHADSMENIIDVSEKDYDKFCEFNLENNIRKNFTTLLCEIAKQGKISIVSVERMTGMLSNLLEQVLAKIDNKIKQKEVEEITENLVIIFTSLGKLIEKEKYLPSIQTIVGYKSGEKPGLSSRTKFKYMDLLNL